ncbi:hypothetical protein [Rhodobacter aestuarii]|nr:hypothetical protein [Rhodobacter aestuarii]
MTVAILALAPALAQAQDGRALCDATAKMLKRSVDATVEQAQQVNVQRVEVSLWFDVPPTRRDELEDFIDKLMERQFAEIDQMMEDGKLILSICQGH